MDITHQKSSTTPLPRKVTTVCYTHIVKRHREDFYQFPEEFYLPENSILYQRARKICLKYKCCYSEAREKFYEDSIKKLSEKMEKYYPNVARL